MAREDLHFRLRIPENVKQRIERAAEAEHRSMTSEIVARLERTLREDDERALMALSLAKGGMEPEAYDQAEITAQLGGERFLRIFREEIAGAVGGAIARLHQENAELPRLPSKKINTAPPKKARKK